MRKHLLCYYLSGKYCTGYLLAKVVVQTCLLNGLSIARALARFTDVSVVGDAGRVEMHVITLSRWHLWRNKSWNSFVKCSSSTTKARSLPTYSITIPPDCFAFLPSLTPHLTLPTPPPLTQTNYTTTVIISLILKLSSIWFKLPTLLTFLNFELEKEFQCFFQIKNICTCINSAV